MAEGDKSEPIKFPEIKLPESVSWQSVEAGKPEEPVFGVESQWPTIGMLGIMLAMRQKSQVGDDLIQYCDSLPGKKPLLEIINGYNIRFHGPDGDPEGAIERFANWLASEGGYHKKVDGGEEQEPLVKKFMEDYGKPINRSFARQEFLKQLLNQLMPAGVKVDIV